MAKIKTRQVLLVLLIGVALLALVLLYVFRGAEDSVKKHQPDYVLTSVALYSEFESDENASNEKYLGKVVEVSGEISEIEIDESGSVSILLSADTPFGGIRCNFAPGSDSDLSAVAVGSQVLVKGSCSGMLMDVVLDKCYLAR
ncbi:MAG TPA: hypothetical protein PLK12_06850 [Prolixibacteraceae bacterium]|nr:hypothetical protein [Prolixibacteraceae bacterium]